MGHPRHPPLKEGYGQYRSPESPDAILLRMVMPLLRADWFTSLRPLCGQHGSVPSQDTKDHPTKQGFDPVPQRAAVRQK